MTPELADARPVKSAALDDESISPALRAVILSAPDYMPREAFAIVSSQWLRLIAAERREQRQSSGLRMVVPRGTGEASA
jgi:hypothetical protein